MDDSLFVNLEKIQNSVEDILFSTRYLIGEKQADRTISPDDYRSLNEKLHFFTKQIGTYFNGNESPSPDVIEMKQIIKDFSAILQVTNENISELLKRSKIYE